LSPWMFLFNYYGNKKRMDYCFFIYFVLVNKKEGLL
jgi:hypothetical protein